MLPNPTILNHDPTERAQKMPGSAALGVIAFGVVMVICYLAASVIETVLVSLILAIFLDPIVEVLAKIRIPRALGAFVAVVLLMGVLGLASFFLYQRVQDFAEDLPQYSKVLRDNMAQF